MYRRMNLARAFIALAVGAGLIFGAAACDDGESQQQQNSRNAADARTDERDRQNQAYSRMIENQPIQVPTYSGDRENINFWVETWGQGPQEAYVYLLSGDGDLIGYYVLDALPTAKCKMGTPPYTFEWQGNSTRGYSHHQVPAPNLTGTYSTGSGDCSTFYGRDLTTGAYVEFSVGAAMSMLTFSQPMPLPDGVEPPPPLGFTTLED